MEFYALVPVVQALEAELACAGGPVRVTGLVAMAWHLRQRDSAQALRLAREAAGILDLLPSEAERRALRFRLALTQCEVAALFGQLEVAEQALADARRETGKDPEDTGDALLAEAVVAKARGQRPRELDAYDRAAEVYSHGRDATRAAIAAAWAAYERTFSAPAETGSSGSQYVGDGARILLLANDRNIAQSAQANLVRAGAQRNASFADIDPALAGGEVFG